MTNKPFGPLFHAEIFEKKESVLKTFFTSPPALFGAVLFLASLAVTIVAGLARGA